MLAPPLTSRPSVLTRRPPRAAQRLNRPDALTVPSGDDRLEADSLDQVGFFQTWSSGQKTTVGYTGWTVDLIVHGRKTEPMKNLRVAV